MNLVSVIIPAYNAAKYLPDAIESVVEQTYSNWELLIIDDGSADNTRDIVLPFLEDKRIKYYFQKNAGVSAARNYGIKMASGDFIAFLDADDAWIKENIEMKLQVLKDGNIDFVFGKMYLCDVKLDITSTGRKGTDIDILDKLLLWEDEVIPCPSGNLLIRKKCFEKGLCFDERLSTAADQDFTIYLARDYKGRYIDSPLVFYRVLPGSMSKNIKVMEKDHIYVYCKARKNNLFRNHLFLLRCYSNLFMILAGSYWKDANNKLSGMYFLILSFIWYPPGVFNFLNKKLK